MNEQLNDRGVRNAGIAEQGEHANHTGSERPVGGGCTLETARFRPVPGTDEATLLAAAAKAGAALSRFDGFVGRTLLRAEDEETWIDLVAWRSPEAARQAAETIFAEPEAGDFLSAIDPASVAMDHWSPLADLTVGAEAAEAAAVCRCVELIECRLKPGVAAERYRQVAAELGGKLASADECLRRELYVQPDTERWLEIVYYVDRDAANRLFERLRDDPAMREGMSIVDEGSLSVRFAAPAAPYPAAT